MVPPVPFTFFERHTPVLASAGAQVGLVARPCRTGACAGRPLPASRCTFVHGGGVGRPIGLSLSRHRGALRWHGDQGPGQPRLHPGGFTRSARFSRQRSPWGDLVVQQCHPCGAAPAIDRARRAVQRRARPFSLLQRMAMRLPQCLRERHGPDARQLFAQAVAFHGRRRHQRQVSVAPHRAWLCV